MCHPYNVLREKGKLGVWLLESWKRELLPDWSKSGVLNYRFLSDFKQIGTVFKKLADSAVHESSNPPWNPPWIGPWIPVFPSRISDRFGCSWIPTSLCTPLKNLGPIQRYVKPCITSSNSDQRSVETSVQIQRSVDSCDPFLKIHTDSSVRGSLSLIERVFGRSSYRPGHGNNNHGPSMDYSYNRPSIDR